MVDTRPANTPHHVSKTEIDDLIDFWDTRPRSERIERTAVRDHLHEIQRHYEAEVFEKNWEDYTGVLENRTLDVLVDTTEILVVNDTTQTEWQRIYDLLSIEDATMRKILRLIHARTGKRVATRHTELSYVLVIQKPDWLQTADKSLDI